MVEARLRVCTANAMFPRLRVPKDLQRLFSDVRSAQLWRDVVCRTIFSSGAGHKQHSIAMSHRVFGFSLLSIALSEHKIVDIYLQRHKTRLGLIAQELFNV